ncbi:ABC transporter ATP-binding protein [Anaerosporobacter faecicola]|uniref:ABC transporter ATP-binding protein n=1 Tax=Anaerosporobacter faecicola TaxID=2718714 RepID=UPI00143B3373|nr:ABC transporter ATP-binding protein [Anaerosporobacter faecicola]
MKLEIKDLGKHFGKKQVLSGVNLTIENGVYGLLGPNGAGKTTLIRMLAGVITPDAGEIFMNGTSKKNCGVNYYNKIGYLPQDVDFYHDFTGLEYLRYIATLKNIPDEKVGDKITHLVDQVNLTNDIHRKCVKYSGGMKKRLGIAQALLNDPEILILDEPTAGLDPYERIKFRNIISSFSKDRTVILSTHIVSDISNISKSIIMVKDKTTCPMTSADEMITKIEDYVWEVELPIQQLISFQNNHIISNIRTVDDVAYLRVVDREKPAAHAFHIDPDLEDAYLYEFNIK